MSITNLFHDRITTAFDVIAKHIETKSKNPIVIETPSIQTIKDAVLAEKSHLNPDDVICTNTFLFCAETLVHRLEDMVKLLR